MSFLLARDAGDARPHLTLVETLEDIVAHKAHGWRHANAQDVAWQQADHEAPQPAPPQPEPVPESTPVVGEPA